MARLKLDPEAFAAWKAAACLQWREPSALVKRIASLHRNKAGKRRIAAAGRAHLRVINADPAVMERRAARALAAIPDRVRRNAERLAAKAGIPVELVEEFRFLRWSKHFGQAEAVAHLRALQPEAFAAFDAQRHLAARRAAGPVPAIGTPERAAWSRRVAASVQPDRQASALRFGSAG